MFSLVVFDLDGTLVDSKRDLANAINGLLVECGAASLEEERVGRMVGDGAATLVARAFEAARIPPPPDALARFLRIYDAHLLDHTRPYAGVVEALDALGAHASLAVLTNKPIAATRRILDGLGLSRRFDPSRVLGGDGPHARKPDPQGLHALIEAAGTTPATTLMVGDSAIDWRTARAAGCAACLVRYGFGFHGVDTFELDDRTRVVDDLRELVRS